MQEFEIITLEEIKKLRFSKAYNIVCINYDEEKGINIFTEEDTKDYLEKDIATFLETKNLKDKIKDMYRIYIFNEEFMKIIFNFRNGEYRFNEVLDSDFKNSYIKYVYSKDPKNLKNTEKYVRLKVRVGILTNDEREIIQYVGYTEGV
ncbi:hypothetical protein [Fusobacterium polymorphum]|jgi:hypothetical protein|uniref:Uncharacterized protein n=2 Tax=Fusobacterium TaxID=848 RepID=A0A241Q128_FUSNP|nr:MULTISPECIES: hypothetical protein [Fusobacterium]ASG28450.1 hypothetical protein CBG61_05605 [Fusobacterium polymorphum]ETZ29910.1 hypothetical protein HMPREF2085_00308 [Fusobacterium nucleatum 13_3C]